MCAQSTPLGGEKSTAEALRSARAFYDRCHVSKGIGIRTEIRDRRGAPVVVFRDLPLPMHFRQEFARWLDGLCTDFAGPWREFGKLIPHLVALACDGEAWTKNWRVPGWLIAFPHVVEQEAILAVGERLDEAKTKKSLQAIRNYARKHFKTRTRTNVDSKYPLRDVPGTAKGVGFRHAPDFTWVEVPNINKGRRITLSPRRASVVRILAKSGPPFEMTHASILDELGPPRTKLRDTFRGHILWGTLIKSDARKRTLRLTSPPL